MQCISGIQISGSGTTIINGNKNVGISVSNASAQVIVKGCNSVVTPSAIAGNLAIVDCIVTALGGNAITITNSATTLTLANSQVLVQAGNNVAPISVAGIYSIFNTIYDKPNSTLSGTSTNSIDYFQYINADKFITQGGTSLQYVMGDGSLSSGFTGGTVTGATRFTNGLTANTISATTYQNLPVTSFSGLSGINLSATTNGEVLTYSSIDNTWKNEKVYNDLQLRRNGITIFDDMIGTTTSDNFQKLTFNNGAWSASTISNENNPGVITITSSSGSSSSGGSIIPSSTTSPRNYAVGVGMQYDLIMRTGSLSANVIMRFGIFAGTVNATQPSDGVYLRLNNNDLVGQTATGNTRSQTAAYTGITTPTWYHFRVKMASADLSVYELYDMDGALLWTDSLTTNLPTIGTGVQPTFIAYNQIAEARQICQVDYVSFTYPPMNRGALI
jgi:hypothetical protein